MNENDRVLVDMPYGEFKNAVLTALERDTGLLPIVGEILRLCRNAMRKRRIYKQRIANLKGGKK